MRATKREVIFNQKPHQTNVFNRQKIETNEKFNGPAIIEESTATTIIPPNYNIVKDDFVIQRVIFQINILSFFHCSFRFPTNSDSKFAITLFLTLRFF